MSNAPTGRSWRIVEISATILTCIAALTMVGAVVWDRTHPRTIQAVRPPNRLPSAPISLDGVAVKGQSQAKFAFVIFSDFECPYCGKFAREIWPELNRDYVDSGKVRAAFINAPGRNHARAEKAAQAGECAARQGKFWELHDLMFARQELEEDKIRAAAKTVGVGIRQFDQCLSGQADDKVRADASVARQVSISGTPTFLVGIIGADGQVRVLDRLSGARPISEFKAMLDKLLGT